MIEGELNSSDKVLRYMSFEKFMDMISRAKIYVPRVDFFDDQFEGSYTKLAYEIGKAITIGESNQGLLDNTTEIRERAFVSCWSLSDFENMALWKLYGGNNSIAIETTVGALEEELRESINNEGVIGLLKKRIVKVDYIDHKSKNEELTRELLTNYRARLRKKAKAYSYEQEIRIIIDYLDLPLSDLKNRLGTGINLTINVDRLINKIYVSPLADKWFYILVTEHIFKDHKMRKLIFPSDMDLTPADEVYRNKNQTIISS